MSGNEELERSWLYPERWVVAEPGGIPLEEIRMTPEQYQAMADEIERLEIRLLAILDTHDPVARGGHCIFCFQPIGAHVFGKELRDPSHHQENCEWIIRRAREDDQ